MTKARAQSSVLARFDVVLADLNPTRGAEIRKRRPCVIISPDEMHRTSSLAIVAPMTSRGRPFPTHVGCRFKGRNGQILLEQIRSIDRRRFLKRLGALDVTTGEAVLEILAKTFAP